MAWIKPQFSKGAVNRSGVILASQLDSEDLSTALDVINNWRAAHNFPLNTFQIRLRDKAKQIDPQCLIAQRIKRLSSIRSKLMRIDGLKLAQIQDIGGCRAIVKDINSVDKLVDIYKHRASRGLKHVLFAEDDYIFEKPKESGYRSAHLVYQYKSDKNEIYNNLKIEVQIRSILQHTWATSVETVDTFTGQSLKSGIGDLEWKRFFALISSVIANKEHRPPIPNTPENFNELRSEIAHLQSRLNVISKLQAYRATLEYTGDTYYTKGAYFLLSLNPSVKKIDIRSFRRTDSTKAYLAYQELEKNSIGTRADVVLVSADSIESLKLAYPNYYADTARFINLLREILTGNSQLTLFD
ncbi:MAG: RelA/SpoT domain-containing protein [Bacteroidota bacterium]